MKHIKNINRLILGPLLTAGLTLISCGAESSFTANSDNSTDFTVTINVGQSISSTIKALTGSGDFSQAVTESDLKSAFEGSDISLTKSLWETSNKLQVQGKIAAPEKQKKSLNGKGLMVKDFVNCQAKSLTLTLSPETIQAFVSSLPEDSRYLLDLFMAPVFTGEKMDSEEYLTLLASVYGNEIAAELKAAVIQFKLSSPAGKKITSAQGKNLRSAASTAQASLPLLDFLTLDSNLIYKINW